MASEAFIDAVAESFRVQDGSLEYQVLDMQGRVLGVVTGVAGVSLGEAIFAKFGKAGVYMVKNGGRVKTISVTR